MDRELFEDLMTSCNEAIAYQNGDETVARRVIMSSQDDDINENEIGCGAKPRNHGGFAPTPSF
jgi:hypothetical protein